MSYVSLGTLSASMPALYWSTDDVYVLRFVSKGQPDPLTRRDALAFVRAVGQSQPTGIITSVTSPSVDVRGVAFWKDSTLGPGEIGVDVIFTVPSAAIAFRFFGSPEEMLARVQSQLQQTWKGAQLSHPSLGNITDPSDAITHWRAQAILWDSKLTSSGGPGGPTDAFANPPDYAIVVGRADDGPRAVPMKDPDGTLPGGSGGSAPSNVAPWIAGAAIVGLAVIVMKGRKA